MDESGAGEKQYELAVLANIPDAEEGILAVLTAHGAEVLSKRPSAPVTLAYKIKKQQSAFFSVFQAAIPAARVRELSGAIASHPSVLRALFVALPRRAAAKREAMSGKPPEAQSPAMRSPALSNAALEATLEEILK